MTLNEPVEAGHDDADNQARITGIVEQTKADVAQGHVTDAHDALRQRFADAGIAVTEEQLAQLTTEVV
jgi:hypothetical protein